LKHVAIVRVEQLAPFPFHHVIPQLSKYPNANIVWVQEEPKNMGAWSFVAPHFVSSINHVNHSSRKISYVGRRTAASPAVGDLKKSDEEERVLVEQALSL